MKRETMERLLIDRALGQLPPDVEELVQTRIDSDPATAAWAGELKETVRLASQVMRTRVPVVVDRMPITAMRRREVRKRVFAMAASFLLGAAFAIGSWRLFAPARQPATAIVLPDQPVITRAQMPSSPAVENAVRKLPFWSYARIATVASAARQGDSTHTTNK
jgi:anti-sigma factor RsiW